MPETPASFTGRARQRTTPRRVRAAEVLSRVFITFGGMGTICAVVLILGFLIWVTAPLFGGAEVGEARAVRPEVLGDPAPLAVGVDELGLLGWTLDRAGRLTLFPVGGVGPFPRRALFEPGLEPSAFAFGPDGTAVACGFRDGSVRVGRIDFQSRYLEGQDIPEPLRSAPAGTTRVSRDGVMRVTPERQVRVQSLAPFDWALSGQTGTSPVSLLDYSITPSGNAYGVLAEDGALGIYVESVTENWMTGESTRTLHRIALPFEPDARRGPPAFLCLSGIGRTLFLIWKDGHMLRFDAHGAEETGRIAETLDLTPRPGVDVTQVRALTGKTTLLVGDSTGRVRAWFPTKASDVGTVDNTQMVAAHVLPGPHEAVTAIAVAARSRVCAIGYAGGSVRLYHVTSAKRLGDLAAGSAGGPMRAMCLSRREDLLLAFTEHAGRSVPIDLGYPEATPAALFGKVWYEGYREPEAVWQSSGGTDDFEAKFSLIPLIFGTLKATLYAMLLAGPLALLAALYTSEFLRPAVRAPIKSTVEVMASLPSVVLGFLAALVIAPFVQRVLPATLACFLLLPLFLLIGARLWQLIPSRLALRLGGLPRFLAMALTLASAVGTALAIAGPIERSWFGGDLRLWLDAPERMQAGAALRAGLRDPFGGWMLLSLPVAAVVMKLVFMRWVRPWVRRVSTAWEHRACALLDLARLVAWIGATGLLAYVSAQALSGAGFDPRGGVLGSYVQRNALIVGFVMGFAIVPIIYTLAEDALSSVPATLREASLGAGATRWQTAMRIILPTSLSGVFGALMIGLGRAVGETMIVLMAAGNTPIMDWNLFNGFRTLSANIAVELPEAVRGSTHYRTLFLAALTLFALTFLINTAAELVRRRVRRRFGAL